MQIARQQFALNETNSSLIAAKQCSRRRVVCLFISKTSFQQTIVNWNGWLIKASPHRAKKTEKKYIEN